MTPQNEQLTPKQRRFFAYVFLLIFLTFGVTIAFIIWKGTQARQTQLAQAQQTRIDLQKQREQRKKNAAKPAKKKQKMPNQIVRGTTGQATLVENRYTIGTHEIGFWAVGPGELINDNSTINNNAPNGWSVSSGGSINVPAGAALGQYAAVIDNGPVYDGRSVNVDVYTFEVVAGTTTPPTGFTGAGWYSEGSCCEAEYYDADGNLTQRYAGGTAQPASGVWGGNPLGPYGSPCDAMANNCPDFPGAGWYRLDDGYGLQLYACNPPTHIETTLQYVQYLCGCDGGYTYGISGPYPSEAAAQPPIHTRYVCENGVCVEKQLCEYDADFATSFYTPGQCALHCGEPTGPVYTRYVCDRHRCIEFQTTDPTEGFASCADTPCGGLLELRYFCVDGQVVASLVSDGSGYATEAECRAAGCSTSPPCLYVRYRCENGHCVMFLTSDQTEGYAGVPECQQAGCEEPLPTGDVYWCVAGHVQSGPTPPAGVTTYPSQQACINAGCVTEPPVYTRFRCTPQGDCEPFQTYNPNAGFATCEAADCGDTTTPVPVYTRYHCDENGVCRSFLTPDPTEGFEDCAHAQCATNPEPGPCDYLDHSIANITASTDTNLKFTLSRLYNPGWTVVVTHAIDSISQSNPIVQTTADSWNWSVPHVAGVHHFIAELTKAGCPETHITDLSLTVTGTGGGNTDPYWCVNGVCLQAATAPTDANVQGPFATASACAAACGAGTPCPPPPDPAQCAPSLLIQQPTENTALHSFARVRVQVSDPNEQTDPCHHNYPRACNHEPDGPALHLYLDDYGISTTWKHISGTPINGIWETLVDTRDYSNGDHQLRVSARGVGCCRVTNSVDVSLQNTLQGNIFYRDTRAGVGTGFVIGDAILGVETRSLEENTSRRYWEQWGVRSGLTLDGPYQHADWDKHQPVLPVLGSQWPALGQRFERHNYSAHVTFRLPLARDVRFRRKWTPQFYLSAFDLKAETVAKIRAIESGRHYIFTTNPARVWMYDGQTVTTYGDFSINPTVDEHELGEGENENDFDYIDRAGSNIYAPNAIDCAVYGGAATGDKVYVIAPLSLGSSQNEVFAFDPDSQQVALEYGIRRENRVARFVEAVNNRVVCLYVHDPAASLPLASKRTRAYDLTFATPELLWQLPETATYCSVDDNTMFVACTTKLYSTDGKATPTLVHDFPADVTTATQTFVGLSNGDVWKKTTAGWLLVLNRPSAITGAANWTAGTNGEAQTADPGGVVAGNGPWLVGERANGTWYDERELRVPANLQGKTVQRVSALDHFSATVTAPSGTDDANQLPQKDERLLVGTANSGLLFIYQRSLLSQKDGAISVSHDGTPRLFPFPKRA